MGDLELKPFKNIKIKSNGSVELPIFNFLLFFNSNIWPILLYETLGIKNVQP